MKIDYRNLEAFALVITEQGFERAARVLHITQSAVSQRIRILEEQYGQILLRRTNPPIATEAGRPLLQHYRQVKQLEEGMKMAGEGSSGGDFGSVAIAINADSLSTWFYQAIEEIIHDNRIVLDLHVDDQELTYKKLQEGEVWGCVTTREQSLQGCTNTLLGYERYGMYATCDFKNHWFSNGMTIQEIEAAPMARYNRDDDLNRQMFAKLLGEQPQSAPTFYIPSTEMYGKFVAQGHCYGILPEQQVKVFGNSEKIINLAPDTWINIPLYWQSWNLKSSLMKSFDSVFTRRARNILRQQP